MGMHPAVAFLQDVMLSRQAAGVALILATGLMLAANRGFIRDVAADPAPGWRILARLAAIMGSATLMWVTLLDDWLQIVVEPYRLSLRWEYQRILLGPIDPAIRTVSVILIAMTVVLLACLAARHLGGYLFQVGTLLVSVLAWIPLFVLNQRLNALVAQGAAADASTGEVLGLALFWIVRLGLAVITIGISLAAVTMALSLVVSIVLDILHAREPRPTNEADEFFNSLRTRSDETPDIPIHSYWRPIRRPL
jgi:hypothetical protein